MSDLKKVVPIIDYEIKIQHQNCFLTDKVLNGILFSEINNYYKKGNGKPVKQHLSLNTLNKRLNNIKAKLTKSNSIAILKGIYNGGTSGVFCTKPSPFLFFDIDVKPTENVHLLDIEKNAKVFEQLKKIAVLVWRSNSGYGIAGIFYVPALSTINNTQTRLHLKIGNEINQYLNDKLNINAKFDWQQNKFRQVRYLAKQDVKRPINKNPYAFSFEVNEVVKKSSNGVEQYKFTDNRAIKGSIQEKFNASTTIENALLDNYFINVGENRYKHPRTTSKSTGVAMNNVFFNHSTSFSEHAVFTPFWLYVTQQYNYDFNSFYEQLKKQGYTDDKPNKQSFKQATSKLNTKTKDRQEQIFTACYDLVNADYKDKVKFANENAKNDKEKIIFYDYLKIKPLTIHYDKVYTIKNYVSEQLPNVLNYAEKHKKIILNADTGTGKTTAFIKDFAKHKPLKRMLILAPLTAIVEQNKAEHNIIGITGNSTPDDFIKAKNSFIVMATFEQGYKLLKDENNSFDFVVIDEAHNLITANGYKSETIKNITSVLADKITIGLTGSPNLLFKTLGYKLIKLNKNVSKPYSAIMRIDNRSAVKIALQHIKTVKRKCILRLNNLEDLKQIAKELIKTKKYTESEILILNSDKTVKQSKDFKKLSSNSCFNNCIKLVLTTSVIDEGLSIKQEGFTDVVFIENQYKPTPEGVKQFFARFRNEDKERSNYFYFKEPNIQKLSSWNVEFSFNQKLNLLIENAKQYDVTGTENKNIANDKYLYYDNKTVNKFMLAYDVSNEFFKTLTTSEYITFLDINYNLTLSIDREYTKKLIDTKAIQNNKKELKNCIYNSWLNNNDEVLDVLCRLTENKEIKKTIDFMNINPDDDIYNIVDENLKIFEKLHIKTLELESLGIENPNSILLDNDKLAIRSFQTINTKINLLKNLETINNPITATDKKNAKKIKDFISDVSKLKSFNSKDLVRLWKKQRCVSAKYNTVLLRELVLHYHNYEVNKKLKKWIKKTA